MCDKEWRVGGRGRQEDADGSSNGQSYFRMPELVNDMMKELE